MKKLTETAIMTAVINLATMYCRWIVSVKNQTPNVFSPMLNSTASK